MTSIPAVSKRRNSTIGEEVANSVSHGLGLLLAIIGLPFLIVNAAHTGSTSSIVGAAIFGSTIILL